MAKVYKAEDSLLERTVAVKVLREQYASDATFLARFRQEARAAAALAHPNIVSVYDVGVDGSWNYIVMEYVDGPSLKDLILQGAPFTTARAIEIASQILSALFFAHQKGLVHRDVKPQNILISVDGQAKVTDFGIARAATGTQFTETGVILGSVHYLSPEQAKGEPAIPASDIYSLGVVMYEMLTGKLPFDSDSPLGVALKHVQEDPQPPTRLNPLIPSQVESIVLKAMAKEPGLRYPNAESMKGALVGYQQIGDQMTAPVRVLSGQPTAASPAAETESGKPVDWFVIILAVLIIGLLAASVPLGYRVYQLYLAPQPMAAASPESSPTATAPPTQGPQEPTPAPVHVMPSLVGKLLSDAERELEAIDLHVRKLSEEFSDRFAALQVIWQSFEPGQEVPAGTTVDVIVSKGPRGLLVPNVVNSRLDDAVARIMGMDLRPEIKEEWNDNVPQGTVFAQKPDPNTQVEKGSLVELMVSRGRRPDRKDKEERKDLVAVPLVVGLPEKDARDKIEESGLSNFYTNYQGRGDIPDSELNKVPVGSVLSQRPPAGTLVKPGEIVYIAVRKD